MVPKQQAAAVLLQWTYSFGVRGRVDFFLKTEKQRYLPCEETPRRVRPVRERKKNRKVEHDDASEPQLSLCSPPLGFGGPLLKGVPVVACFWVFLL